MNDMSLAWKGHLLGAHTVPDGRDLVAITCLRCNFRHELPVKEFTLGGPDLSTMPDLGPCPNCPTCRGPNRETVGLVCPTCGTDYGGPDLDERRDAAVGAVFDDPTLSRGERIALMAAAEFAILEDAARNAQDIAVRLEQELAETKRHLEAMVELATRQGTTWAKDDHALTAASEHLASLDTA